MSRSRAERRAHLSGCCQVCELSLLSLGIISGCLLSVCPNKQLVHSHMPLPYISIYAGCAFMCVRELLLGQFIWTPLFPIILLHIKTSHISHMDYCFNHLNKWPWPLQSRGWDGSACHKHTSCHWPSAAGWIKVQCSLCALHDGNPGIGVQFWFTKLVKSVNTCQATCYL